MLMRTMTHPFEKSMMSPTFFLYSTTYAWIRIASWIRIIFLSAFPKRSATDARAPSVEQNDDPDTTGTARKDTSNGNNRNNEKRVSYADVVRGKMENEINKGNDDLILLE